MAVLVMTLSIQKFEHGPRDEKIKEVYNVLYVN